MTFLEFFEALLGCAQIFVTEAVVKDPTTPRPSTTMTGEQSVLSMTGSPSRGASQVYIYLAYIFFAKGLYIYHTKIGYELF